MRNSSEYIFDEKTSAKTIPIESKYWLFKNYKERHYIKHVLDARVILTLQHSLNLTCVRITNCRTLFFFSQSINVWRALVECFRKNENSWKLEKFHGGAHFVSELHQMDGRMRRKTCFLQFFLAYTGFLSMKFLCRCKTLTPKYC